MIIGLEKSEPSVSLIFVLFRQISKKVFDSISSMTSSSRFHFQMIHSAQHLDKKTAHYRIVVLGAARVGKSSIISQFLHDKFIPLYRETIEELHRGEYSMKGDKLVLDILDTSGAYIFPAMRQLAISTGDAFVLVYSVDDEASFDVVKALREQILACKSDENIPIVIVGNKIDLPISEQLVMRETVEPLVSIEWNNGFVEASAKLNLEIVAIFQKILRQFKFQYALSPAVKQRRRSMPSVVTQREKLKNMRKYSGSMADM